MADIIRYDGTRWMTEEDVDRDFKGKLVLLDKREFPGPNAEGYLYAVADDSSEDSRALSYIAIDELDGKATVVYGCESRGEMLIHVEIFDEIIDAEDESVYLPDIAMELVEEKI